MTRWAMPETLQLRLLVATPGLTDPNFERSVVYLIEHDDEGAVGVVLNRPSHTDVETVFAGELEVETLTGLVSSPPVFFIGGPVSTDSIVALGSPSQGGAPGLVDLATINGSAAAPPTSIRLFAGYAGWASGQLEAEIASGAWVVVDAAPDDVFHAAPDNLWREVLRRQGGVLAQMARYPDDVSVN